MLISTLEQNDECQTEFVRWVRKAFVFDVFFNDENRMVLNYDRFSIFCSRIDFNARIFNAYDIHESDDM